jgi:putative transposase
MWFAAADLAGLPGLPATKQGVIHRAARESWPSRPRQGRGGGREYPIEALPQAARDALAARLASTSPATCSFASELRAGFKAQLADDLAARAAAAAREEGLAALPTLPPSARRRADARLAVLDAFERYSKASGKPFNPASWAFAEAYNAGRVAVDDWVRQLLPDISQPSLARWRRTASLRGVAALAGAYGNRKGTGRIDGDPAVRDLIVALLVGSPHVSAKNVMRAVRARIAQDRHPGYRTVQRFMTQWKAANAQIFAHVANPDAARGKYRASFGRADEGIVRLNQRWEMDSTPADLLLKDGRHVAVGCIDVWSRRARLQISKTSKSTAVAACLRRGLIDWGAPELVATDNGTDYTSVHIKTVLGQLGIEQHLCPPFTPQAKPFIESFFKTFSHGLVELLPGFIGHNVAERQAIEARRSFAERFMGHGETIALNMTAAEFQDFADRWLTSIYERERHSALGASPFARAAEWRDPVRHIGNERALDILLAPIPDRGGVRVVQKTGIHLDGASFVHPDLAGLIGERVALKYDEADLGRVFVFSVDGPFVCVAECPERTGVSRREIAVVAGAKQKARLSEQRRALKALAKSHNLDFIAQEILAERADAASNLVAFPAPAAAHETDALAAAADAAAGRAPRAAGAGPVEIGELPPERIAAAFARLDVAAPAPAAADADGRPHFDTDKDFVRWVLDNPDRADAADKAWAEQLLKSKTVRLQLGLEPEKEAAGF